MRKSTHSAIQAIARKFAAAWDDGEGPPDAYLTIGGHRVAVDLTALPPPRVDLAAVPKPRLRFDKVALRFINALRTGLRDAVPEGITLIVTITAPIRLPAKTAARLEDKVRECLAQQSMPTQVRETIHGNQLHVRRVSGSTPEAPRLIGFVHNSDSDPGVLLDMAQSLVECFSHSIAKPLSSDWSGDRWLVIVDHSAASQIDTYRLIASQFAIPTGFKKVLMVVAGDRVETLAG